MISGTAKDLPKHREQVRLACIRTGFDPGQMMEHLTAEDANAVEVSLRMIEAAEIYLCVLAHRYGYVLDEAGISITEMEYNRADEPGRPQPIFFVHDDHPLKIEDVETGTGTTKLSSLKERIGKQLVAPFYKSADDLRGHVVEALSKHKDGAEQIQRSQQNLQRRGAIPQAPAEYVAHQPCAKPGTGGEPCGGRTPRPHRARAARLDRGDI